jgi:membrane protein
VKLLQRKRPSPRPQVRDPEAAPNGPAPQPEHHEPKVADPGLFDLSRGDVQAILIRAAKKSLRDGITDLAAALAYYLFLAIPATLLVAVGLFTLIASPDAITTLMDKIGTVTPSQTTELLGESLRRLQQNQSSSIVMTIVGLVLALWTTTGAMTALMRALNRAYERGEGRNFLRQRVVALQMLGAVGAAFLLVFGLLVLGPLVSKWIGDALDIEGVIGWLWWIAQWPVLIAGLLAAFATVLYLGPNVEHRKWQFITPGSIVAVVVWLAASGGFAVYTSMFGSYNKTWGSLAAVIVMLTWLWLTALALLFGAEVNAEAERSRELRQGRKAAADAIQAPAKT